MQYSVTELNRPMRMIPTECIQFMEDNGFVLRRNSNGFPSVYYAGWQDVFFAKHGIDNATK